MNRTSRKKGITLLEAVFVIGIILILFVFGIKPFEAVRDRQTLNKATEDIEAMLQEARSKSVASVDASSYGVHFEIDRATLFPGAYYSETDPDNETIIFDDVELSNISLVGGGMDVVFNRITGDTNNNGTIRVTLIEDPTKSRLVTIFPVGTFFVE